MRNLSSLIKRGFMKKILICLFVLIVLGSPKVFAYQMYKSESFNQERMITSPYGIIILSPFDDQDGITAYNSFGYRVWEVMIKAKVLSFKLYDGYLYVLSKSRYQEKTYLTCIDPSTGYIVWERP